MLAMDVYIMRRPMYEARMLPGMTAASQFWKIGLMVWPKRNAVKSVPTSSGKRMYSGAQPASSTQLPTVISAIPRMKQKRLRRRILRVR